MFVPAVRRSGCYNNDTEQDQLLDAEAVLTFLD